MIWLGMHIIAKRLELLMCVLSLAAILPNSMPRSGSADERLNHLGTAKG